ncbi:polymeric immunoglobulin receptor-like [Cetorhinus maximus]
MALLYICLFGALWAAKKVTLGRAITMDCHYEAADQSNEKYWCHGMTLLSSILAETNQQCGWQGRMSITDNKSRRIFIVTMEDLRSGDTGWYNCGIEETGNDPMFAVELQISDESVSAPVFRFLSPPNVSCSGGSVSISCESVQGSLPIQYTWYEKTLSEDSKISDTNKLDLHCQSFKQQHHQYYCTVSNNQGEKSSEMVNVSVINRSGHNCTYVTKISSIVSGELWADKKVTGIVGRAITINCHYDGKYQENMKYWCHGRTIQCSYLVRTDDPDGRRGTMSITDNKSQGIFVVTMEDLHAEDTGWYSCGIDRPGLPLDLRFSLELQISDAVSGELWADKKVTGIVGRAITINCHYDGKYQENMKYWCHGRTIQCSYLVRTDDPDGRRGTMSITDNKSQGIFVVTMEDLHAEDTGWYSCGIDRPGLSRDLRFSLELQISDDPVSVPVLKFSSPPNVSCSGGSVSISCESVQGSLPIQYTWYEKTLSEDSKISDTNKLDLHCQSFKQQRHQYYCTASNNQGEKPSEMVNVLVISISWETCVYVTHIGSSGPEYSCDVSTTTTHSTSTKIISTDDQNQSSKSKFITSLIYIVLGVLGGVLVVLAVSLLLYLRQINKHSNAIVSYQRNKTLNDNEQLVAAEESTIYENVRAAQSSSPETHSYGDVQFNNSENGIIYATLQFQKKPPAPSGEVERRSLSNTDNVIYSGINIQSQSTKNNRKASSLNTP